MNHALSTIPDFSSNTNNNDGPRPHDAGANNATATRRAAAAPSPGVIFNLRRARYLTDLIRNLDLIIYAELSAIYCMDVSFLALLLRCLVQLHFLTPNKPTTVLTPPPSSVTSRRPLFIILVNLVCVFLHARFPAPEAGEATRGYLHGGLAMDFIGQKGPVARWHLVCLDLSVLLLQIVCLAAVAAKKRAEEGGAGGGGGAPPPPQTLESEERGELAGQNGDVELRELNRRGGDDDDDGVDPAVEETEGLLRERVRSVDADILDDFASGEIVVADLCMSRIVRQHM